MTQRTYEITAATQRLSAEVAEKEDFLRAVSHDLNAPLRNIDGMVSLLLRRHRQDLPQEAVHRLERIRANVQIETELINDLLELSRIKTRRGETEPVNLEALVWELRGMFDNDLRERAIDLILETPLPTLLAEKGRIRQVFQNLIDNAIKYMGESPTRQVRIGCHLTQSEAEFYVTDTGMGISAEDLDKVFYIFRRGRNHTGISGKGVGLATVKSIVETYYGTIRVESEPGLGSTFRFTINRQFVAPPGAAKAPLAA